MKKSGSHFDLPIAYNLLKLILKEKSQNNNENIALIGELSLDGKIVGIKGTLSLIDCFKNNGIKKVIIPYENYMEASLIEGIDIVPLKDLGQVIDYIKNEKNIDVKNLHKFNFE